MAVFRLNKISLLAIEHQEQIRSISTPNFRFFGIVQLISWVKLWSAIVVVIYVMVHRFPKDFIMICGKRLITIFYFSFHFNISHLVSLTYLKFKHLGETTFGSSFIICKAVTKRCFRVLQLLQMISQNWNKLLNVLLRLFHKFLVFLYSYCMVISVVCRLLFYT